MLSKCANPSCSAQLVYLREGKIFMMEADSPLAPSTPDKGKSIRHIEHFWLCGPCSAQLTLAYDQATGVRVVPKHARTFRAAAF